MATRKHISHPIKASFCWGLSSNYLPLFDQLTALYRLIQIKATMKVALTLAFSLQLVSSSQIWGCDTCTCWETCLENAPKAMAAEYADFHMFVQTVRGARLTHNIHGSGYMLDQSTNDAALFQYEKDLASLVALTSKVSPTNNPFVLVRYTGQSASSGGGFFVCQDTCDSDSSIQAQNAGSPNTDGLNSACHLVNFMMRDPLTASFVPCQTDITDRNMVLAFMNSDTTLAAGTCPSNFPGPDNVRIAVRINGVNVVANYPSPDPTYNLALPFTNDHTAALDSILTCVRNECCDGNVNLGRSSAALGQERMVWMGPDGIPHVNNKTTKG